MIFDIQERSIFDKPKRNEPVDKSKWFINPDAFVLIGQKKYKLEFIEVMSVIKHFITEKTDVTWSSMVVKTRKRNIVFARQMFHYFCREFTNASLSTIGAHGGGKDHATVLHSCRVVNNLIETDSKIRLMIQEIKENIERQMSYNTSVPNQGEKHDTIADWSRVKHKYIN
jgi:hypothetical protein